MRTQNTRGARATQAEASRTPPGAGSTAHTRRLPHAAVGRRRGRAARAHAIFFLRMPMNLVFSSSVWKRPWPNLDDVSMNLSVISSAALREVLLEEGLAERDNALARADDAALEHDVVLLDEAVVRPAADRVDAHASRSGRTRSSRCSPRPRRCPCRSCRPSCSSRCGGGSRSGPRAGPTTAPWPGAGPMRDLAQATVRLARQARAAARDDALEAVALADADDVDHLVLREDGVDGDLLLEEAVAKPTLSSTEPPLTWISIMCAFFWPILTFFTCVCAMTRTPGSTA